MAGNKRWTEQEKSILREHYSNLSSRSIGGAFEGRSERALATMATRLGLHKSQERLSEMGAELRAIRTAREREEKKPA